MVIELKTELGGANKKVEHSIKGGRRNTSEQAIHLFFLL